MENFMFYFLGLAILFINKIRYTLLGYRTPRPFPSSHFKKMLDYDRQVVKSWTEVLSNYTGQTMKGKVVLELGPGADLGQAVLLLHEGASTYTAIDANNLIQQTPQAFYERVFEFANFDETTKTQLKKDLSDPFNGSIIQYIVDPTFDLKNKHLKPVDVIVSQAAFEHFSDIEKTISELGGLAKEGTIFLAEIDLMTHTNILRSRDPLNIYRYPEWIYKLANFPGIPNRVRPKTYKHLFESSGWYNVDIIPLQILSSENIQRVSQNLSTPFDAKDSDMHILSFVLVATKGA